MRTVRDTDAVLRHVIDEVELHDAVRTLLQLDALVSGRIVDCAVPDHGSRVRPGLADEIGGAVGDLHAVDDHAVRVDVDDASQTAFAVEQGFLLRVGVGRGEGEGFVHAECRGQRVGA